MNLGRAVLRETLISQKLDYSTCFLTWSCELYLLMRQLSYSVTFDIFIS